MRRLRSQMLVVPAMLLAANSAVAKDNEGQGKGKDKDNDNDNVANADNHHVVGRDPESDDLEYAARHESRLDR